MSKTVIVRENIIKFALNHIVQNVARSKGIDSFEDIENIRKVNLLIENEEFPSGYYYLCDAIGVEYRL